MIPAEAVEAAWNAMPRDAHVDNQEQVRAMLEAAAPFIALKAKRAAWDEFVKDKWDPLQENPYKQEAK